MINVETLTKDDYIRLHRELWGWLVENPDKRKKDWPGWANFDTGWAAMYSYCFACAYTANITNMGCDKCLLNWGVIPCDYWPWPGDNTPAGLFARWLCAQKEERSRLAALIRDLPVRERATKTNALSSGADA